MSKLFSRLLNLRSEEAPKVTLLVLMFFLFITGTAWAETIIESSFYYQVGVQHLSQVFILHALASLVSTTIYSAFADRISNQKLLVAIAAGSALLIGLGLLLLEVDQVVAYTILYVLVRAVRTSFVIHWWNYASDFYDARASKRIVPVINASSRFAIIVASLTIPLLNRFLTAPLMILLWVMSLLIISMLSWMMNRLIEKQPDTQTRFSRLAQFAHSEQSSPGTSKRNSYLANIREGFQYVSSSNYLRWVALSTVLMVVVFALLNYQGGLIFAQQFKSRAELTNFIGYLNGFTSLILLPVQLFLFSRIVSKIGVGNANVIFPLGTLLISSGVLLAPVSLVSGSLAHFNRNTFRYSTQETSNNLLYNAVPARVKGRARSFIDGLVLPLGLLASSALLELGKLLPSSLFLPVLLGLPALAYLAVSLVIRRLYSRAMISLLEQEDYASLLPADGDVTLSADPAAKNILLKKLVDSQDDSVILVIVRILTETAGTAAMPLLEMKARESSPVLRAGIVEAISSAEIHSIPISFLRRFYRTFLNDQDENVRLAAFIGLQRADDLTSPKFLDLATRLVEDPNFEIRSQALTCLLNSKDTAYLAPAQNLLKNMLQDPTPLVRSCAVNALRGTSDPAQLATIIATLDDSAVEVRLRAAQALETRFALQAGNAQSHGLELDETASVILSAANRRISDADEHVRLSILSTLQGCASLKLKASDLERIYRMAASALVDSSPQVQRAAQHILVLAKDNALPSLLELLSEVKNNSTLKAQLKATLCRIDVRKYGDLVEEQIRVELKLIYFRYGQIDTVQGFPGGSNQPTNPAIPSTLIPMPALTALITQLIELNQVSLDAILNLLAARHGEKSVQRIIQSLEADSSNTRANANEALEALIQPSLVRLIMPLFDTHATPRELARAGANAWPETDPGTPAQVMHQLVSDSDNELNRAFAVYALGEMMPALINAPKPLTVENKRKLRLNLLDKLLEDDAGVVKTQKDSKPIPSAASLIKLEEVQELITLAQNDSSSEVRSAAFAASRLSGLPENMPASRSDQTMIYQPGFIQAPDKPEGELMTASLPLIERIIFLKQVALFQSMTIEQLKILASICEDEFFSEGTVIFKEGDPGGVVYVVVNGRISIERAGERKGSLVRLSNLEARASFGEMNLFESSPRSASAVAIQDSLLLKLRAEPFLALIRQNPDMSLELIKVLSVRLREANDQITHLTRSTPRQLQNLYDKLEEPDGEENKA